MSVGRLTAVSDDALREAAVDLVRMWQRDAEASLIALDVWPELVEAIDRLGEAIAPPRARMQPGMKLRRDAVEIGDVIRFDYPPRSLLAAGFNGVWAVEGSRADASRPGRGYWRLHVSRPGRRAGVESEQAAMDDHGSETVVWLGRVSDFPDGMPVD